MADLFSWESIKSGLEIARHSQALVALVTGVGMSAATWLITKRSYDKGDLRTRLEVVGFEPERQPDGTYLVDFPVHGNQMNLSQVIGLPRLERKIVAATRQTKNGFLVLKDARSHRLMMGVLEDHVTGNDDRTHTEALDGVLTRRVETVFAPAYFYEEDEDVSMIRIIKISEKFAKLLQDANHRLRFKARHPRKEHMLIWSIMVATNMDAPEQQSSSTAFIWRTTLKASFGGAYAKEERVA